ncbi:Gfo/Idh/MocA family oxidoreductase [soil metagenome]
MLQINWGIIGCGNVTEKKSGPAFSKIENSSLVAVMRRNGEKAKDYARRHNIPRWYDHAKKLIHDPEVNAIYIATPPDSHLYYAKMAAKAGKPVYIEKPMALNYGECKEMVEVFERYRVPLFVAYYRRYLNKFIKIKNLIASGEVGDIRTVHIKLHKLLYDKDYTADWRVQPDISGGGYFFDLASHQLDLIDFLLGPINAASGFTANQAGRYVPEDIVTGIFKTQNGVLGTGSWCFTVAKEQETDHTEIIGSKGQITFSIFDDSPINLKNENGMQEFTHFYPEHVQQPLIAAIVADLQGKDKCNSTGRSGARASLVMDMMTKDLHPD